MNDNQITPEADVYPTATPFGMVDAVFEADAGGVILRGTSDAVAYLTHVIGRQCDSRGMCMTLDSIEPADYFNFCQPPGSGIMIIEPAEVTLDPLLREAPEASAAAAPVLDATSDSWHSQTINAMRRKSDAELRSTLLDSIEAAEMGEEADPPNLRASQYRDEAHYAALELARRRRGGQMVVDNAAVDTLKIALEVLTTNEPINRAEGKTEQADLEAEGAVEIQAAIVALSPPTAGTEEPPLADAPARVIQPEAHPGESMDSDPDNLLGLYDGIEQLPGLREQLAAATTALEKLALAQAIRAARTAAAPANVPISVDTVLLLSEPRGIGVDVQLKTPGGSLKWADLTFGTAKAVLEWVTEQGQYELRGRSDAGEFKTAGNKMSALLDEFSTWAKSLPVPVDIAPFEHAGLKITVSGDRWLVQSPDNARREAAGERQLGGDAIVRSREAAIKEAEFLRASDDRDRARIAAIEAQEQARLKAKQKRSVETAGKTLAEIRAEDHLNALVKDGETGELITRREWIKKRVAAGDKPTAESVNKVKPMSRAQINRSSNEEQREHDRKVAAGGKVFEYWLGNSGINKTEYDLAVSLLAEAANKAPVAAEAPTTVNVDTGPDLDALALAVAAGMMEQAIAATWVKQEADDAGAFYAAVMDTLANSASGTKYVVAEPAALVDRVLVILQDKAAAETPAPIAPAENPVRAADMGLLSRIAAGEHPDMLEPELADEIEAALARHPGDDEVQALGERAIVAYSNGLMNATG